jgi:hypothetical protein
MSADILIVIKNTIRGFVGRLQ